jgi:hypothetical protein
VTTDQAAIQGCGGLSRGPAEMRKACGLLVSKNAAAVHTKLQNILIIKIQYLIP